RFQDDPPGGQFAVTPVGRLNQVPGALRGIGAADDALAGVDKPPIEFEILAIRRPDAMTGVRITLEMFEPPRLLLLAEMKPELDDQRAIVGQHIFKEGNAIQFAIQLAGFDLAVNPLDKRLRIPGTKKN